MMSSNVRSKQVSVLFVCLGNICRSPSAQAVFEAYIKNAKLSHCILVDSCGTASYHINEAPDSRAIAAAKRRGYIMAHLRGRQLCLEDFERFDYILAMDKENLANIQALKPVSSKAQVALFLDFDTQSSIHEVPDPYYGGAQGFEQVLNLIESASVGLLQHLQQKHFK